MHFIDTHCHLDLYPNYSALIETIEKEQIYTVAVTNTPSVFRQSAKLAAGKKYIRTALGLHPQLVVERHGELDSMISMLNETKYIGEVGLDFATSSAEERSLQERVFRTILQRCDELGDKILTIHSRRAASRVIDLIGMAYNGKIIMHWFSGSPKELVRAINYGFYFSVNLSMVTSGKGRDLVKIIPRNRILTESDGPFVKVNGKSISPSDTKETVTRLAELFQCDAIQMKAEIYKNFRSILIQKPEGIHH